VEPNFGILFILLMTLGQMLTHYL